MRYVIIEDESPAQRLLKGLVEELRPDWQCSAVLDSVESSVDWFQCNEHPEVVFMDIQLSDGISFDILKDVALESLIIFTTAYDEYALQAFNANSLDYLLKPIKRDQLEQALAKYDTYTRKLFKNRNESIELAGLIEAVKESKPTYRSRFLVTVGETYLPLPVKELAFFFSRHKITSAVTVTNKRFVLDFSLDRLEEQLDPGEFFRVSRQCIVNIDAVHKVHSFFSGKLILETIPAHDEKITVSREKARAFKQWLDR